MCFANVEFMGVANLFLTNLDAIMSQGDIKLIRPTIWLQYF